MTDATTPFGLALNTQREIVEAAVDGAERARLAPEAVQRASDVEVGGTPSEVIYTENKLELVHYEPLVEEEERSDVPILIVYALINKPFILDLQPDRSVVRRLLEAGHDVYLIDWNEPSRLDQFLTLEDYVDRYMDNCVDAVREDSGADAVNLLGYCMGGTMSVMYTALHGEKVNALGLMAAGLCFEGDGGVLELWGDEDYFDPEAVVEAYGNVPAEFLDIGFALMDPVQNYVSKYLRFYDNLDDEDFVENFARMERWLDEGIDVAGRTFVQFLEEVYQENRLYRNEMELGGRHVDVTGIDVPILQILGEYDHLVPPGASKPFNDVVGSDDVTTIEFATGHIGLSVSSSSHADLWPRVAEWYHDRSPERPAEGGGESEEAVEIDVEGVAGGDGDGAGIESEDGDARDVEAIDGIGPTYAGRLRDAGLDTLAALAAADPGTVAEAAEVGAGRATNWIDRAATLLDGGRD